MAAKIFLTLPSGQKLPAIGLGTFDPPDDEEMERSLNTALEFGYRHIDTAFVYESEKAVGKVLKQWISSGKLKREELFITTKLPMMGVHPDRVEMFMKKSLENLQLDYVDLYLIHFPVGTKYKEGKPRPFNNETGEVATEGKTDHVAVWKKMEEQVDAGRTKNIGLSNYNISQIETVLKIARIKPAVLQIEVHVCFQQKELVDFCKKNKIEVVAYSPFANPGFNNFLERIGEKPKKVPDVLGNPTVGKIAEKHKKSPAQIALRFLLQYGVGAIPRSINPKEIKENISLFDFELDENDMKLLKKEDMEENGRLCDFLLFKGVSKHPDFPFKLNSLQ